jgi:cytochrome c oxidase assembly protein subunit 15
MSENTLRKFLLSLIIVVIFMMLVGAITRLTGSGLSIPEWPLINGTLMYPASNADWNAVFDTYKKYPQYHLINKSMTLSEFKWIFFYEYFHRSITSLVSLLLLFITLGFYKNKSLWKSYKKNVFVLFALLVLQALVGYYMVKSGLEENMANVSQYRLATHLSLALIFLSVIYWTYLQVTFTRTRKIELNKKTAQLIKYASLFVFVQILSGALMAGTKAGYHFSDWPLMNGEIIPTIFSMESQFASNPLLNFTENIANIQFFHRLIAYCLTAYLAYLFTRLRKEGSLALNTYKYLPYILIIQVALGIITLVLHVPVALAALHQFFAIVLFLNTILINYAAKK